MFSFKNISIKNKLVFIQVFTSILVLFFFFIIFMIYDVKEFKQHKVDTMQGIAQIVATNSVTPLLFQDNDEADKNLSELLNASPDIMAAIIFDTSGNMFASYKRDTNEFHYPAELRGKESVFINNELFVSKNIKSGKETLGTVVLKIALTELNDMIRFRYNIALILLGFAILFAVAVAFVIQGYISRRLLNMAKTLREVGISGDYNRKIMDDGRDEISLIAKRFNEFMDQIKENQEKKDEFISIASHELKTPLTSVKSYAQLLARREFEEPVQLMVDKILSNVQKLEKLIQELLDVSKIQRGMLQLDMQRFYLSDLIKETVHSVQMISQTHTIIAEDFISNPEISGDKQRLEQVLVNLLSNAIKYSPGEKKVILQADTKDDVIVISVRDFGVGIPDGEEKNIFKRFYRTKDVSSNISGFGLGLYICESIISRHGGKIWVTRKNTGSLFCFTLPLCKSNTA